MNAISVATAVRLSLAQLEHEARTLGMVKLRPAREEKLRRITERIQDLRGQLTLISA